MQVTTIEEMNNAFFVIYATEEPGNFYIYDLQIKHTVHHVSLNAGQRDFFKAQGMENKHVYSFIYKVPLGSSKTVTEDSRTYTLYPS